MVLRPVPSNTTLALIQNFSNDIADYLQRYLPIPILKIYLIIFYFLNVFISYKDYYHWTSNWWRFLPFFYTEHKFIAFDQRLFLNSILILQTNTDYWLMYWCISKLFYITLYYTFKHFVKFIFKLALKKVLIHFLLCFIYVLSLHHTSVCSLKLWKSNIKKLKKGLF